MLCNYTRRDRIFVTDILSQFSRHKSVTDFLLQNICHKKPVTVMKMNNQAAIKKVNRKD